MKRISLTIATLAVLALPVAAVTQNPPPKPATEPATHNQNGQKAQPKPAPMQSVVVSPKPPNADKQQSPSTEEREETIYGDNAEPDWWASLSNLAMAVGTLALAIIGGIAAKAAFKTLHKIGEQTKAAQDSAEAARLNSQAVIDSERPWLVVTPVKNSASVGHYFFFRVMNKGRTPAKLVSGSFSQTFLLNPNKLPIPAEYDKPFLAPNDRFLPPEGYFDIYRTEDERIKGVSPQAIIKSRSPNEGPSTDILLFYGNLIYDDVLGKERPSYKQHETRWCFAFFPDGMRFVRTGPDGGADEYNSQT